DGLPLPDCLDDTNSATHSESLPVGSGNIITTLAELPDRTLLDETALAEALGVTKRTIRRMVGRFELPPPVRFAGRSTWQVGRVVVWFEARADRRAREAERQARKLEDISRGTMDRTI